MIVRRIGHNSCIAIGFGSSEIKNENFIFVIRDCVYVKTFTKQKIK